MSRKVIELVQVLVDRIHQGGYTQRALEDDIYAESQKRIAAEKDRDHWKLARQEAHEAGELMRAEIETLKGAMAADDQRLRDAEKRVWSGGTWGCDAADKMADEIVFLRQRLADAEHPPAMAQQRDEIAYLRARLDEERSVIAGLREQLDAAQAAVTLQRAGIERLNKFVGKVRELLAIPLARISYDDMSVVRAELAALDDEPTPVAEPLDAEGGA